jgi:hypothetical protein
MDIHSITVWLSDYDVSRMTQRVPHPYNEGMRKAFWRWPRSTAS